MTASIRCPRCTAELHVAHGQNGHVVCACLSCGGVWLNAQTANEVKTAFGEWAMRVADHAASTAQIAPDTHSNRSLVCPSCQKPMRKARVPGVGFEIDVCDPHGTFYDRGELSAALSAVRAPKKTGAHRLYVPAAVGVGVGVVAVGAGAATAVALSQSSQVQAQAQAMSNNGAEMAADAAEIALDVASEVDVGDALEVGGALVEGGASVFGFLFEALGAIDF